MQKMRRVTSIILSLKNTKIVPNTRIPRPIIYMIVEMANDYTEPIYYLRMYAAREDAPKFYTTLYKTPPEIIAKNFDPIIFKFGATVEEACVLSGIDINWDDPLEPVRGLYYFNPKHSGTLNKFDFFQFMIYCSYKSEEYLHHFIVTAVSLKGDYDWFNLLLDIFRTHLDRDVFYAVKRFMAADTDDEKIRIIKYWIKKKHDFKHNLEFSGSDIFFILPLENQLNVMDFIFKITNFRKVYYVTKLFKFYNIEKNDENILLLYGKYGSIVAENINYKDLDKHLSYDGAIKFLKFMTCDHKNDHCISKIQFNSYESDFHSHFDNKWLKDRHKILCLKLKEYTRIPLCVCSWNKTLSKLLWNQLTPKFNAILMRNQHKK